MPYKFKKNQQVQFEFNMNYRDTGGPFIPMGTKATVLKRCRGTSLVWVNVEGFGTRREDSKYMTAA